MPDWIAGDVALWMLALGGTGLGLRLVLLRRPRSIASMLRPNAVCAERPST